MKFIFADSLDLVDPDFDFVSERPVHHRRSIIDAVYPHELLKRAPYDGMLLSQSIVGVCNRPGKYTCAQAMRLRRDGARKFLRLEGRVYKDMLLFGDSGAFSYINDQQPPYTVPEVLGFYADAQFTHGCAVDHIIPEFDRELNAGTPTSDLARYRYDLTLTNARDFLAQSRALGPGFTPVGVAQGWSPASMGAAARSLERMGYRYIALGGLVKLAAEDIHRCLQAVRERVSQGTRLHLLGFGRAEQLEDLTRYGIASFDTSSPLLRAFKDARANYYLPGKQGLEYFTALRIPQSTENRRLVHAARRGDLKQEQVQALEAKALEAVRGYDRRLVPLAEAVARVAEYGSLMAEDPRPGSQSRERLWEAIRVSASRTLSERPWSRCRCVICRNASVDVLIFRCSNRNKRRGFHNLGVFSQQLARVMASCNGGRLPASQVPNSSP